MRVIKSPIGSFNDMCRSSSPARLQQAGDQALGPEFPQRDAAELVFAIIGARPAGQLATVADARGRRVARHFGELQRRREALFHRLGLVARDRLQLGPPRAELFRHLPTPIVLLYRTLLRHSYLLGFRV